MGSAYPFNLGGHTRAVSTESAEAQLWFDRGLNWCFGFHHEEAVRCFERALQADPRCAMAHWGAAYASGPFYNLAWREFGVAEAAAATASASAHLAQARACLVGESGVEAELVEALGRRFQAPHPVSPEEYDRWDTEYAAAMRRVHWRHPDDLDVAALFAEALITRTPRRLWDVRTGCPAREADVLEALAVCERGIAATAGKRAHAALCHMHIHILEMSGEPERAMGSADALAGLCPDAGHLTHMPGHIYALCGRYEAARAVSERAVAADDKYGAYDESLGFYITARAHDLHLLMSACMFLGQYRPALAAADKMQALLTRDVVSVQGRPKLAMMSEGYVSMRMHVLVRFGRWHDILTTPAPAEPALYPVTTAMHHYARGVALASSKRIAEARSALAIIRGKPAADTDGAALPEQPGAGDPWRRRGDARGRAGVSRGGGRGGVRAAARGGAAGRCAGLHGALGLDASAAPCAGGATGGAGAVSRRRRRCSARI